MLFGGYDIPGAAARKVHGDREAGPDTSEWPAVIAAHQQLRIALPLEKLDERLHLGYERERQRREHFRERLVAKIEQGSKEMNPGSNFKALFSAFKHSVTRDAAGEVAEERLLVLVARAITELLGNASNEPSPSEYARAFHELILAVSDRDDADDDREIDDAQAAALWETISERLSEEYDRPQGGFARLMYGGTRPESRRMIQLAFNRPHSFPRVLVAQSLVGREGLNLHRSCRIVVLLHPEWNPAVVEQQIGRVDRVGSHWCNQLKDAIDHGMSPEQLPRIEVRPVIFCGTYDEHNWQVLRMRWDDLRAQLHGIVISPSVALHDDESRRIMEEITEAAPNFSPTQLEMRTMGVPVGK